MPNLTCGSRRGARLMGAPAMDLQRATVQLTCARCHQEMRWAGDWRAADLAWVLQGGPCRDLFRSRYRRGRFVINRCPGRVSAVVVAGQPTPATAR